MKTSSRKAKGRRLQDWSRQKVLETFPELSDDDVKCAIMGERGTDLFLSPAARKLFNYSVECKNHKSFSVYKILEQAEGQDKGTPLAIIKANYKEPMVLLYAEDFFSLLKNTKE